MVALRKMNEPEPVKLTIQDFVLLDRSGAFDEYGKTELIEGVIVAMNSQYRAHAYAKGLIARRLTEALEAMGSALGVLTEASVSMPPRSMPIPDVVVTGEARGEGPVPLASVALLVEIADTTADFDLGRKAQVYAAAGVPEYWVVDLQARAIRQLWGPGPEGYAEQGEVALGERAKAVRIAGLAVETGGI